MSHPLGVSARDQCGGWLNRVHDPLPCSSWPIYRLQGGAEVAWTCGLHLSSAVREIGEKHRSVTVEPLT